MTVERAFGELLREATDALIVLSISGDVLFWNRGAEAMFGYSTAEAVGRSLYALIVPLDHQADARLRLEETLARGASLFDARRQHKDGTPVLVTVSMRRVDGDRGDPYVVEKLHRPTSISMSVAVVLDTATRSRLAATGGCGAPMVTDVKCHPVVESRSR